MKNLNENEVCEILNEIMEYELAGVVRYTHSSLMVSGPNRIPIVEFLQAQATESLLHAQQAGELITGLDGHPSQKIAKINESNRHSINDILHESLEHEIHALNLYKKLLDCVESLPIVWLLKPFVFTVITKFWGKVAEYVNACSTPFTNNLQPFVPPEVS